jgi:hypothetical protein
LDLTETGCEGVDRIELAQDKVQRRAFVETTMNIGLLSRLSNSKLLKDCTTKSDTELLLK